MRTGIFYIIQTALYAIMLAIIFFRKKNYETVENRVYRNIIIVTVVQSLTELALAGTTPVHYNITFLTLPLGKIFCILVTAWYYLFCRYAVTIALKMKKKKNNKGLKIVSTIIALLFVIAIAISPIKLYSEEQIEYTYGLSVDLCFIASSLYSIIAAGFVVWNIDHIRDKRFFPLVIVLVFGPAIALIQYFNKGLLIATSFQVFTTFIMYFTIENPDIKELNEVKLARSQAERSNRAKSDFLSSMSHEIRTPLNTIVGLSQDIEKYSDRVPREVVEDTNDIIMSSQNLLEIVGNVLDINKIENNTFELVNAPYNFTNEVIELCKILTKRIGHKNIKFNLDISEDTPYELIGDKNQIKEIIKNIVTNAIKYTEKGEINLKVDSRNDLSKNISYLTISCEDTGKGIKEENLEKIFENFTRLNDEINSSIEGIGLGLSITKSLVEMMGGTISVQSKFGVGSTFTVKLSQKISVLKETKVEKVENNVETNEEESIVNTNDYSKYKGKKVLIVDDNKLNIKVARKALESYEFIIDECYDGQECIFNISSGLSYDLILMDIMMPIMDGVNTLKRLKEDKNFKTPVIALTADAVTGAREKYLSEGFTYYISKPFSKNDLYEAITKAFESSSYSNGKAVNSTSTDIDWDKVPTYSSSAESFIKEKAETKENSNNNKLELLEKNGIEYQKGIELLGDLETYNNMITDWFDECTAKFEKIKDAKEKKDIKRYAIEAHSLKSDSKYFGFTKLASLALEHETKAKENNEEYINSNFDELEKEFIRIAGVVDKYLD